MDTESTINFNKERKASSDKRTAEEKNILTLTIIFIAILFIILGIQIIPYFYGGAISHSHGGGCAWPYNCKGIHNL